MYNNPPITWRELNHRLSDWDPTPVAPWADGGDAPAWSHKRAPYEPPPLERRAGPTVPYAELHCHTNFSFLDGASHPEELAEEAARLGLEALAVTDHDGFYGIVRFAEAAREVGLRTIFGAELTLGLEQEPVGDADPPGEHLVVLARGPDGYARLARAIATAHLRGGQKNLPQTSLADLAELHGGHWQVLTGCRKGAVLRALVEHGPAAAQRELQRLVEVFGRERVTVELHDHGDPLDSARNDALVRLAHAAGVDVVATGNVHYATPSRRRLATALAAVRSRRSLDEAEGWLPATAGACLRSGAEQARRFARYPGVVERAAALGLECTFDLHLVAPNLPPFPCPPGLPGAQEGDHRSTEMQYLRLLVEEGGSVRYGPREHERVPGAWKQIDHELAVIDQLGFPGYFLVVWDIVEFCRRNGIFCQGRGSAANSAVCYALRVTNADAVTLGLLFERFLSPERDGPPDIDVDIESDRREEVIQYVYEKHGRENAAQVANVITYRARSAVRDMGKALGHAQGQVDAWSKQLDHYVPVGANQQSSIGAQNVRGVPTDFDIPEPVLQLASEVEDFPRHLGIHSGGMVICDRPVVEVCPVEWGRMPNRTVLQWDKDDCAATGLVKFDLLGLGMLSSLRYVTDLVREFHGDDVDIAMLDGKDPAVYEMLCEADSVGVFQVESRAQMATLPRLKPRTFYDLVVEVALIRPGPIQGGSVHPYIRRRNNKEEVTYLHPLLKPALEKTLGVPLFQEQLMQMAIDVAGFSGAEADQLRQAMGSKRSRQRMEKLRARLYEGMAERGITGDIADAIYEKLAAFANFGFPESHSVSFAYLVYSSAWFKLHYPAAFCASLLNAQPMGFWSPHTLTRDARRHGVMVRRPDVNASDWWSTLEHDDGSHRGAAVRLGIKEVRAVGDDLAKRIAANRPYTSMEDCVRRAEVPLPAIEALATAGAFRSLGLDRREALWAAGATAQAAPAQAADGTAQQRLPGVVTGVDAPSLPGMSAPEETVADLWATGISAETHPTEHVRAALDERGVLTAEQLRTAPAGERVFIGGVVTHRQRPATASGTVFLNIEDETGLINVICSSGLWRRFRRIARTSPGLVVRGTLERVDGVINIVADKLEPLPLAVGTRSRDFR